MNRIGQGWDLHRLVFGRKLMLGGIQIPSNKGEAGHSDGDVLIHAIVDALLGALALGDIGTHFPPADPQYKDQDSMVFLEKALRMVQERGFHVTNIDTTIILEQPKLKTIIPEIRRNLSEAMHLDPLSISVKAKTKEHIDGVGEGIAIEAQAIVLLQKVSAGDDPEEHWV